MRRLGIAAVVAALGVLATVAPPADVMTRAEAATAPQRLRVASFNVTSVAAAPKGLLKPWKDRRAAVIDAFLWDKPDVVGVQEATASKAYASQMVDSYNQFRDLQAGLVKAGVNYRLTNPYAFNCVDHTTSHRCQPQRRGASGGTRILYNADRVELVAQDAVKFAQQEDPAQPRYFAWALLKLKANGKQFLFIDTHLNNTPETVLVAQWKELLAFVQKYTSATRPIVTVGDFNTSRWNLTSKEMLPAMKNAGVGDVLNQSYNVTNPTPRAASMVNGWIDSYNDGAKDVKTFSYWQNRARMGNTIDYVFATNSLAVAEWKVVLRFNTSTLWVSGNLPSDHNMVRADVMLP